MNKNTYYLNKYFYNKEYISLYLISQCRHSMNNQSNFCIISSKYVFEANNNIYFKIYNILFLLIIKK